MALSTRLRRWPLPWMLLAACVSVFLIWPELDLTVTRHVFDAPNFQPANCHG